MIAAAAGLTVLIETGFMALVGYRRRVFLVVCALVNLASNLTLNLMLDLAPTTWRHGLVPILEVAVVIVEWAVLRLVVGGPKPPALTSRVSIRLGLATLATNALSFGLGQVIF